jgi:hypothetical protein
MAAGPVAAGLGNLEKWSDLKLVCGGKEFRVHKVYVCSQSPVLAAACNGDFAVSSLCTKAVLSVRWLMLH